MNTPETISANKKGLFINKLINFFKVKIYSFFNESLPKNQFKLIEIKYSAKYGHEICIIQVSGKNIFPEVDAQYLVNDPNVLRGFSSQDIITITRLADKITSTKKDAYSIKETYSENKESAIVVEINNGIYKVIDIKDIDSDFTIIDKFSPQDAYILGRKREKIEIIEERNAIKAIKDKTNVSKNIFIV